MTRLILAALILAGCGTMSTTPTRNPFIGQYQYARTLPGGTLLGANCEPYAMNAQGEWIATPCRRIEVVAAGDNAVEAWHFEQRVLVRGPYAIPMGRQPVDTGVVGPRAECERVRADLVRRTDGRPTEPCEGPIWFRYVEESNEG